MMEWLEPPNVHSLSFAFSVTWYFVKGIEQDWFQVCMGGEVPKSYYQSKPQVQGEMQLLSLAKRSKKQFEFHPEANSFLK
jgi:hypothetical protein